MKVLYICNMYFCH